MQATQAPKTAIKIKDALKPPFVGEKMKQSPKKLARAERIERKRKRKLERAAIGKKATKRSKQKQPQPMEVAQNGAAEIATSTQPQTAGELATKSEASARKTRAISGVKGKEANDSDSTGNVPGEQATVTQTLDDIMDDLESSKDPEKPKLPVKVARRLETLLTDTGVKSEVVATLKKHQKGGELLNIKSRKADAIQSLLRKALGEDVWSIVPLIESTTDVFPGLNCEKRYRQSPTKCIYGSAGKKTRLRAESRKAPGPRSNSRAQLSTRCTGAKFRSTKGRCRVYTTFSK